MAYVLLILGVAIAYLDYLGSANVVAAGQLIKAETFTGTNPYYKWMGALIIVALIGYIPSLQGIATAMLTLIILAIILSHFDNFTSLLKAV